MFQYFATVLRVVDGDTLWVNVDLGFRVHLEIDLRLAHIDTPEIVNFEAAGIVDPAKNYIMQNLPIGSSCVVNISRAEKYGRWLADVFYKPGETDLKVIMENPRYLNDELIKGGFAKGYEGGKK